MSANLKAIFKYLFLFLIGIGILFIAFKGQDLSKIWLEIKSANVYWVIISALSVLVAHVLRALRWQMLYQSLNYKVNFFNAYNAVMVGYLANLALPRFGEIAKCSIVQKTNRVPMFASIGTVVTERLFDVFVLLATGLAMLLFQFNVVADFLYTSIYQIFLQKISSINYWFIIALAIVFSILGIICIWYVRKKFNKKFLRILVGLKQGFNSYFKLKNKFLFLVYTLSIWLFYFLSMYFAFFALNSTSALGLAAAFTTIVFSGFAMVAPVQGGIGVFHWMIAQSLILYAIPFNDGLAYATVIHSAQFLLVLVLGSLSLLLVMLKK